MRGHGFFARFDRSLSGRRHRLAAYAVAVLSTASMLALRIGIEDAMQGRAPLILFIFAITMTAWMGGLGPGLTATGLSSLVGWFFLLTPRSSFSVPPRPELLSLAMYTAVGAAISLVCERMHQAIERSNRKLAEIQAIYDTAPIGLCVLDTDLRYVRINNKLAEINGLPAEAHIGKKAAELLPDVANQIEPMLRRILATGEPVLDAEIVSETEALPGVRRAWMTSHYPLRDERGKIEGICAVCEEITFRKRAEQEQAAAEAEREAILASERAARAQAEHANRMKDEFLAVISHELRTPLHAILGWATLLRRPGCGAAQIEKGLTVIDRNARQQVQLISDLLDVSRIITGKLHVDLAPVSLRTAVESAVEALRGAAAAKEIELREDIAKLDAPVPGDADRLAQIVTNLVSNAIKFTPRGGHVSVSLALRGAQAELSVRDDGAGIRPEFLPHVFDRFRQADASTTRAHGGLGLGLAIVKHLVEAHGGTVRASSDGPGQGATFTVSLPYEAWRESQMPVAPISKDPPSLRGVRVLVLDDEEDARDLVARVLEEHAATVETASSAAEALRLLERRAPDVLVSDIGMPEMDGYALLRTIRSGDRESARVPAIALTAFARAEDRERALSAGYEAHLVKPIEPVELITAVAKLSARERSA